mgnify:CR=1 FL=1
MNPPVPVPEPRLAVYAASEANTRGRRHASLGDAMMIDIAPVVDGYPSDYTWSGALGISTKTALVAATHEFAQAVDFILTHPEKAAIIAKNARDAVHKYHSWEQVGKKLLAYYESVINSHR